MTGQEDEYGYIRQVLAGESDAFRFIVRQYESPLFRYVLAIVKDEAIATDVVQETFIKVFINLRAFDIQKKFSSWIYRIAHNEALNAIKRWRREISLEESEYDAPDHVHPMDLYEKEAEREQLLQCLSTLKPTYAAVLILHFLEDRTYEEIAEIVQIPIGTVGTRITRGKIQLHHLCQSNTNNAQ